MSAVSTSTSASSDDDDANDNDDDDAADAGIVCASRLLDELLQEQLELSDARRDGAHCWRASSDAEVLLGSGTDARVLDSETGLLFPMSTYFDDCFVVTEMSSISDDQGDDFSVFDPPAESPPMDCGDVDGAVATIPSGRGRPFKRQKR